MEKNKKLFNHSGCLNREAILAWLENSLSQADKYFIEKHLEECILCKDALEGLSTLSPEQRRQNFADISYTMQQRLLIPVNKNNSRRLKISLAAAIFLVLIGLFSILKITSVDTSMPLAHEISQPTISSKTPSVSSNDQIAQNIEKTPEELIESKPLSKEKTRVTQPEKSTKEPLSMIMENNDNVAMEAPAEKKTEIADEMKEEEVAGYTSQPAKMAKRSEPATTRGVQFSERALSVDRKEKSETTFYLVEEPARFEGGDINKFRLYVEEKLNRTLANQGVTDGTLTLSFTVDSHGKVRDVFVVKSLDTKIDSVAATIVKNSPEWEPAKQQGKPVNVNMALSLNINPEK